jgi:hypothetical protein
MPSLREWQREFAANLPDTYRINVFGNWEKALAGAYPIVRKIVGNDFFGGLAREYAAAFPSQAGDLNEYGERLADFFAEFRHAQDLPYLPDVARMEWRAHRAYYAPDPTPIDTVAFSHRDPGAIRLRLSPSCGLLASRWPLARIWEVHQDDYDREFSVDLGAGHERILICRPRWRAEVRSLSHGDYGFLSAALAGAALGEALEIAAAASPDFDAASCLARWAHAGALQAAP